jgi:hypothetical protein
MQALREHRAQLLVDLGPSIRGAQVDAREFAALPYATGVSRLGVENVSAVMLR